MNEELIEYVQLLPDTPDKWRKIALRWGMDEFDNTFILYANSQINNPRKWENVGRVFVMDSGQAELYYNELMSLDVDYHSENSQNSDSSDECEEGDEVDEEESKEDEYEYTDDYMSEY